MKLRKDAISLLILISFDINIVSCVESTMPFDTDELVPILKRWKSDILSEFQDKINQLEVRFDAIEAKLNNNNKEGKRNSMGRLHQVVHYILRARESFVCKRD